MSSMARLMPGHDPHWRDKLEQAKARQAALLAREGTLTAAERAELAAVRAAIDKAFDSSFRTTAEYRDFHLDRARELLAFEGIRMTIPDIPDDAPREEIDRVLAAIRRAVERAETERV